MRLYANIRFLMFLVPLIGFQAPGAQAGEYGADRRSASSIDYAMYYLADIRDAEECTMRVEKGELVAYSTSGKRIANPSMTCPDMFSWKLFMEVVNDRFWSNWADELQNWPAEPYALCEKGQTPGADHCCKPGSPKNDKTHCPVFPGVAYQKSLKALNAAKSDKALSLGSSPELLRKGRIPFVDHIDDMKPISDEALKSDALKSTPTTPVCGIDVIPAILEKVEPADRESVGRVIRQTNAEITVRNETFHDYLFENNLYNANGVVAVFRRNARNIAHLCGGEGGTLSVCSNAPYHRPNRSASPGNPKSSLSRLDFPFDAIMIKSNWLHEAIADRVGMKGSDKDYISKALSTQISLTGLGVEYDASRYPEGSCNYVGIHYLVAFHISSKDIPNWVWTTFEHVDLPGRCDITGCNDAFGYISADDLPKGVAANYVKPNQKGDQLNSPSTVFAIDAGYAREKIRPQLQALFKKMNIGTGTSTSVAEPDPQDSAWLNYRLKGSQVEYVDATGRSTLLGNSVTEAGFMDGSSCITCHARAGIHVQGDQHTFTKLSVFMRDFSDFGYARSAHGIPNKSWYNDSDNPPRLQVLQTDFIWGFLFAEPVVK